MLLHEAVDFGFPRCGWMGLRGIPEMRAAAREPDVEIGVGIGVETDESQEAGVVFLGLGDAIDERAEFEGNDLNVHAELL